MNKKKVLLAVNKVYNEQNPSNYFISANKKNVKQLVNNKKKFLIERLKLPLKIFKNSELLDLGCGSGQNTINYDWAGAKCTLVDYDKKSTVNARNLFGKFAKNKFKVYRKDLFKFNLKKKFDFVISNGVAHHTFDTVKSIKLAINFLKKDGILILGLGETNGFFQRNLQRYILYSLSENEDEIIKLSKLFFKDNLKRAHKYGGRTVKQIIHDTYINPKIDTLSFYEIKNLFEKNNLYLYSSDEEEYFLEKFTNNKKYYFSLKQKNFKNKNYFANKNFLLNSLINFSSIENSNKVQNKSLKILKDLFFIQSKITHKIKDQSFHAFKKVSLNALLKDYKKTINLLKKIEPINIKETENFLNELSEVFIVMDSKIDKISKIKKINNIIKKNRILFKGRGGKGLNYFVGMKL